MTLVADLKGETQRWTPTWAFICTLKNGTTYYWSLDTFTWNTHLYSAVISSFSPLKLEGGGVYGVDAVQEIDLEWNNQDQWMSALLVPTIWQGGVIQPFFFFRNPLTGEATTDTIAYPKFLLDLPSETWPTVVCTAHNKWNLARKSLPMSTISQHDRYPFPNSAADRAAAYSNPSSPFYALGYSPENGHGAYKTGSTPYTAEEYTGTREMLREIGLEIRWGGMDDIPPTDTQFTPKKGQEKVTMVGSANPAKYGMAVPLAFGRIRATGILLHTGGSPSGANWSGARLSHFLLADGVNFGITEADYGCEISTYYPAVAWLTGVSSGKLVEVPQQPDEPNVQGSYNILTGKLGSQSYLAVGGDQYRNVLTATDFPPS